MAAVLDLGAFALFETSGIGRRLAGTGPLPSVLVSAILSFALAATFNYLASARWVFKRSWRSARRALQFAAGAILGLAVNAGTTAGLAAGALWPHTLAKVAGIGLAFGVNYLVNARWVFAHRRSGRAGLSPGLPGACGAASRAGGRTRRWAAAAAAWPRRPSARE